MNCQSCGAALTPIGNRNHMQCEHCGRFHFPDEPIFRWTSTGEPSLYSCPVCPGQVLDGALLEGHAVSVCPKCRGLLSDLPVFGHAVASQRSRLKNSSNEQPGFDPAELRRGIKCPKCRQRMETYPYAGGGNAVVDACDDCQLIWLDAGELEVITNYLPTAAPRSTCWSPSATPCDDAFWSLLSGRDT